MKELYSNFLETIPSLEKKTIAITGTTSGTGYWTAVCAIRKNASTLVLLNRESERSTSSLAKLQEEKDASKSKTNIFSIPCDLMSFSSVKSAAEEVLTLTTAKSGLDVLVNNAGIMAVPDKRTEDGFDRQMQVNHLSHFLLTHLLFPALAKAAKQKGDVRIVQHSSGARNHGSKMAEKYYYKSKEGGLGGHGFLGCFERYHQTKLANSTFAMALNKKIEGGEFKGLIKSCVAEPGASDTNLPENLKSAHEKEGTFGWGMYFWLKLLQVVNWTGFMKFQTPADGAMPLIMCAFGNKEEVDGGDFYVPENTWRGLPFKVISKGEKVLRGKESMTMNTEFQKIVWNSSEKALGIDFFSLLK
eukprot:snap_masked-scaffold_49-processed-gene-1.34-mRNA-1 protein AED:0.06 eAED:0.08 QI:0/-1/0/1/-1/1/1/0/357